MDTEPGPMTPWPGANPYEGIPFRGPQMNLRQDDPPHLQPKVRYEPHVQIFDFADEKDIQDYIVILDSIARGESPHPRRSHCSQGPWRRSRG